MGRFLLLFLVFFPMLTSFAVYPLRRRGQRYRNRFVRLVPTIELLAAVLLLLWPAHVVLPGICGMGLQFSAGSLHSFLTLLTTFVWLMTSLAFEEYFATAERGNRFYQSFLVTLGALVGVFLAADFFTLFIFFEMMSFVSYVWVAQNESPGALRAGDTYMAVAVIGGMVMLIGLFLLYHLLGTLRFGQMGRSLAYLEPEKYGTLLVAGFCCLFGLGAKAGVFPLHIWLPKAHPVAPAPASALLSGILTKSGIFGMLVLSTELFAADVNWNFVLLILSLITMVLGGILALFSVDLKRTLACSSVSQIGFILMGIAMQGYLRGENALAIWGTVLHMMNHTLIKLVLFVGAGVVYLGVHKLNLNDVRGWGRNRPWLKATFFIGAATISGVPMTSGYVSKTLLHECVVEYIHVLEGAGQSAVLFHVTEWLFLFSGGLTVAYMTKLFVAVFVQKRAAGQPIGVQYYMLWRTRLALTGGSVLMVLFGLTPNLTMENLAVWAGQFLSAAPHAAMHYFSLTNLYGTGLSLAIGAIIYIFFVRKVLMEKQDGEWYYRNVWPRWMDLEDSVYRPAIRGLVFAGTLVARVVASVGDLLVLAGEKILFLRAPRYFEPKQNDNFGAYKSKPRHTILTRTFRFDLMLSGAGLVLMLLYVLFS